MHWPLLGEAQFLGGPIRVRFMEKRVEMGYFSEYLGFPLSVSFHQWSILFPSLMLLSLKGRRCPGNFRKKQCSVEDWGALNRKMI
jgi:hypothetical protein